MSPADSTRRLYAQLVRDEALPVFAQAQVLALPTTAAARSGPAVPPPATSGRPPFKGLEPF